MISSRDPLALLKMAILTRQRKQPAEKKECDSLPSDALWSWQDRTGAIANSSSAHPVHGVHGETGEFARDFQLPSSPAAQCSRQNPRVAPQFLPHGVHILHNPSSECVWRSGWGAVTMIR